MSAEVGTGGRAARSVTAARTLRAQLLGMVTGATVLLAVGLAPHVHTSGSLRRVVVFAHLIAVVVGFGATFAIDAYGVLWLRGRRTAQDLRRMVEATHVLVWGGVLGLSATGAFLSPTLERTRTQVKMVLVLLAVVNGAWSLTFLHDLPDRTDRSRPPQRHLVGSAMVSAVVSQACWWGASVIGFLTTMSRRG